MQRAVSWAAQGGSTPPPAPILVRVQHHPSRSNILPRLLERLGDLPTEVVEHAAYPPNPWQGYKLCLQNTDGYEHVLVIQDDAIPCSNFEGALRAVARPVPVVLCLPNMPMRTRRHARDAIRVGAHWVELHHSDWLPVIAVLWPQAKIKQLLEWDARRPPARHEETSDDGICGRWMRKTAQGVVATLPSLVEHPDDVESTWRGRRHPRRALWFIGDVDPMTIEW